MSIKGLEQAIANLNSISEKAVPRASAQSQCFSRFKVNPCPPKAG